MPISVASDRVKIDQVETMISSLRVRQSESSNDAKKKGDIKKQLAYLETRKSTIQSQPAVKVPNIKEQIETSLKLLKFVADSQLTLTQVNGQRKLGPPPGWTGPPPGPKCEIFVGSIPRNYYEPEIVLIFSTVGKIYELRLMMEFSGTNRGYCFIMYTTEEEAARAVRELDQYEIYPGKRIGVVASTNNCRLYINQLPRTIDSASIIRKIYEITDDVDKVAVYRYLDGLVCYVLVSYKTHRGAAMGRRRLVPEAATLFKGSEVNVEWANPHITPSNVFEECGVCDELGNVKITKTFIEPMKTKKVVVRSKQRSAGAANQRAPKLANAILRKERPIKAAVERSSKISDSQSKQYNVERYLSKGIACPNCSLMKFVANGCETKENFGKIWNVNENQRNNFNQFLLYEDSKRNCSQQDQSNAILPSISTYLNKGKRLKTLRWNDAQRYSDNLFRSFDEFKIFDGNLSNSINKCTLDRSCRCRLHYSNDDSFDSLNNFRSVNIWNSTDDLVKNFSGAVKISDDIENANFNGYEPRNVYKTEQIPMENNAYRLPNVYFNSQSSNEANRQLTSCYANYYQHFEPNSVEQSNEMLYSAQNVQEPPLLNQEHFLRKFPADNVKPITSNQNSNWFSLETLPNQVYRREFPKFPEITCNSIPNLKYANNYQLIGNCQQQNYDSFFMYENAGNSGNNMVYSKDAMFGENKSRFG
ncbi:unnamed protein product [Xylocopa violacea]|uniref:RRM domain-containing protein n=1 Tax=Xylocopa violacea TaxID=135666 RepID=A0ABP1N0S7_XYLVO